MEGFRFVDIYSTKGIEYLIAGGFFFAYMAVLWYMSAPRGTARRAVEGIVEWFRVPEGFLYHQGHSWLKPLPYAGKGPRTAIAGMDDYAQKLLGPIGSVSLPPVGTKLRQGERGWSVTVDGHEIPMLSPVDGEVVAVNVAPVENPAVVNREPFGKGWLIKVASPSLSADARNLLCGKVAKAWLEEAVGGLRAESGGGLGPVMQDGGLPVPGIARALFGEEWAERVRREFLVRD